MSEPIIIYDIQSLPEYDKEQIHGLTELFNKFREMKTILWDSSIGGKEPRIIDGDDFKIIDVNDENNK